VKKKPTSASRHKKVIKKKTSWFSRWFPFFSGLTAVIFAACMLYVFLPAKKTPPCANTLSCNTSFMFKVENGAIGTFNAKKIIPPSIDLSQKDVPTNVLGVASSSGQKHIYVDLTTQTLTAFEGDTLVLKTFVSTGKWRPTPTGDYTIWIKLKATRMSGGEGADYYNLPNVPYVMFFYNNEVPKSLGFSLHGAYWHNNFGHPMSHGCVNMRTIDAQKLYNWVNPVTDGTITYATKDDPGTKITITGETP
jgi:lipoprotein-anchoring transpeptidase ErfK/SrfK